MKFMPPSDDSGSRFGGVQPHSKPLSLSQKLSPWRWARDLKACELYWVPVRSYPIPAAQRRWLLRFFELFSTTIASKRGTNAEIFLQMKVIHPDLANPFIKTAPDYSPIFGLSRRPGSPLPALPDMHYVEELQKGTRKYNSSDGKPDYCYWFLYKAEELQRQEFFGHGGLSWMYVKPDQEHRAPQIKIPPKILKRPDAREAFKKFDLQKMLDAAYAMKSGFLCQSKEMFGGDLKEDPMYNGLPFIIPLLDSQAFLGSSSETIQRWFSLFEFYVNETVQDKGIILASKTSIQNELIELLADFRDRNEDYPL
jgi:hypothetical protein